MSHSVSTFEKTLYVGAIDTIPLTFTQSGGAVKDLTGLRVRASYVQRAGAASVLDKDSDTAAQIEKVDVDGTATIKHVKADFGAGKLTPGTWQLWVWLDNLAGGATIDQPEAIGTITVKATGGSVA